MRATLFACGLAAGLCGVLAVPRVQEARRGALGSGGAVRTAIGFVAGGALAALIGVATAARPLGGPPAVALGLTAFGLAIALGLLIVVAGFVADRQPTPGETSGVSLRALGAGSCGALAIAAWALASGHVLGQRHSDAQRHALDEARDLVALTAERALVKHETIVLSPALAPALAPADGWLVTVDSDGHVLGGVGAGVEGGTPLAVNETLHVCRASFRTLPCAARRLEDGTRAIAAVPARPVGGAVVLAFALVGLLVAGSALAIGGMVGGSTARDLDRVSSTVDELRRSGKGGPTLEEKVIVASLDEIGALTAALERLRARLEPMLAEHRAALDKAQAADHARDAFLQLVSVELRSPLDQIIAAAEVLLAGKPEPLSPEQRDDVNTVLSASRHLTGLIDEVLDISAIATGQIALRPVELDVGALVTDVGRSQRPLVQPKGVELRFDVEQPSPKARADERRLRQVITNLVSNAVKFTHKGSIELRVKQAGGRVEVAVADTGPGIAPEQQGRLFREFVQLGSGKQRAHGTGLGLAICKRLVEAHGGEIKVVSEPGKGATFTLSLPVEGPTLAAAGDDTPVQAV